MNKLCLIVAVISLAGCASVTNNDLLPEKSRATPELALLNQKAQLADAGGEAMKAEALYKAVLRQTPNDTETWYRLGNLYANNNHPGEAAIAYERALVSDNSHVRAWHNLAVIRMRQSYAAMMQASLLVDPNDSLAERIDTELEQYSAITSLDGQPKPTKDGKQKLQQPTSAAEKSQGSLIDVPAQPPQLRENKSAVQPILEPVQ